MKRILAIGSVSVLVLILIFIFTGSTEPELLPPTITHNVADLDKIDEISKYRSCAGHVVVPPDSEERKRNMKHYFNLKSEYENSKDGIPIYAPFDAKIGSIRDIEGNSTDEEISFTRLASSGSMPVRNDWELTILHSDVLDELNKGDEVKGGQLIGHAHGTSFDLIYATDAGPLGQKKIEGWNSPYSKLESVFNHMSDQVFAEYVEAGLSSKEDIVLTKEQRDAQPCIYRGSAPDLEHPLNRDDNWIKLHF